MTASNSTPLEKQLAELTLAVKIFRVSSVLIMVGWFAVQVFAYVKFDEIPFIGWEFLAGALIFLAFFSRKKATLQKQVEAEVERG